MSGSKVYRRTEKEAEPFSTPDTRSQRVFAFAIPEQNFAFARFSLASGAGDRVVMQEG